MSQTFATVQKNRFADAGTYVGGTVVKQGASANSCQNVAAVTDKPAGLLARTPDTAVGDATNIDFLSVVLAGPAEGLAGAAVAIDDDVVITATGTLVPKAGAGYVIGKAMTPAANGEYFEIMVNIRKEPA